MTQRAACAISVLRGLLAALAACLTLASLGSAQAPGANIVVIDARGMEQSAPDLEGTLREHLVRLSLELATEADAPDDERVVAYAHIEHAGQGALVLVRGARNSTLRVRRQVAAASSPALFRETLALIVLGAVETLVGEEVPPPEPPEPAPVEPATPPPEPKKTEPAEPDVRHGVSLGASAHGGPRLVARDRAITTFGGSLSVTSLSALAPSLTLDVTGALPSSVRAGGVDAKLNLFALRAIPRVRMLARTRFALEAGVAAGLDLVSLSPRARARGVEVAGASRRVQPMLGAVLSGRIHVSSNIDLWLAAGADLDLSPRRWVVSEGAGQLPLFELSRVRPYLSLGLAWTPIRSRVADESKVP